MKTNAEFKEQFAVGLTWRNQAQHNYDDKLQWSNYIKKQLQPYMKNTLPEDSIFFLAQGRKFFPVRIKVAVWNDDDYDNDYYVEVRTFKFLGFEKWKKVKLAKYGWRLEGDFITPSYFRDLSRAIDRIIETNQYYLNDLISPIKEAPHVVERKIVVPEKLKVNTNDE